MIIFSFKNEKKILFTLCAIYVDNSSLFPKREQDALKSVSSS